MSSDGRFVVFAASNEIPGQENARISAISISTIGSPAPPNGLAIPPSFANSHIAPHAGETL